MCCYNELAITILRFVKLWAKMKSNVCLSVWNLVQFPNMLSSLSFIWFLLSSWSFFVVHVLVLDEESFEVCASIRRIFEHSLSRRSSVVTYRWCGLMWWILNLRAGCSHECIFYHPFIAFRCFLKSGSFNGFVRISAGWSSVLIGWMVIQPLST